jgi:integrase
VSLRKKYGSHQESEIALANQPVISTVSVNIELRHLKAAMGVAEKWKLVTANPFAKGSLVTIPQKTPAFLTVQDAEILISSITKEWLRDIVIFALNSGMRRNEILFLRWIDFDAENRVARITNRQGFHTKSGLERSVSLNDTAMMVLNRRKASSIMSDYIFTDDIGRQLLPSRVTHAFKDAVRSSNLSPYLQQHLHAHSLRHSFISQLAVLGTPAFLISRLAGHNSTQTTAIYMHLNPKLNSLHSEVSKLSFGMSPSNPLKN